MDLTDLCDDIYMFGYPEHTHEDLNAYWEENATDIEFNQFHKRRIIL